MAEVWAGMATLPERAGSRAMAATSLLPQVDRLTVARGDELGDAAKFASCSHAPGVFLGVDDDLIYPPGYVAALLDGLARHPGCIVSFHGYSLGLDGEIVCAHPATDEVAADVDAHVVGTGVCAFCVDTIRPTPDMFRSRNAADVWLALAAEERGIRRVVLAHPERWFGYVEWPATIASQTAAKSGAAFDGSAGKAEAIRQLVTSASVSVFPVHHSRIAAPSSDHIARVLATGDYYESDLLAALAPFVQGGEWTVIDVGANVGNHAAFFAGETAAKRVIAIEPNPEAFRLLQRTVAASGRAGRIRPVHAAVHPEWGSVAVSGGAAGNLGMAEVREGGSVATVRLDNYAFEPVRVVKVDAEGLSADVLRSGRRLLRERRPVLAVEERDADEGAQVAAVLEPLGYRRVERFGSTPTWVWRTA